MNTAVNNAAISNFQEELGQASLSDHDRENLIELWAAILTRETNHDEKRHAEARMRELINGRSLHRVREMELERGLRAL